LPSLGPHRWTTVRGFHPPEKARAGDSAGTFKKSSVCPFMDESAFGQSSCGTPRWISPCLFHLGLLCAVSEWKRYEVAWCPSRYRGVNCSGTEGDVWRACHRLQGRRGDTFGIPTIASITKPSRRFKSRARASRLHRALISSRSAERCRARSKMNCARTNGVGLDLTVVMPPPDTCFWTRFHQGLTAKAETPSKKRRAASNNTIKHNRSLS